MSDLPWSDCKVAYGIDDYERFERAMMRTDDFAGMLPAGWRLCEVDGTGARCVAVFRVEDRLPTVEDGRAVERLLARHGGYRPARAPRKRRSPPHGGGPVSSGTGALGDGGRA